MQPKITSAKAAIINWTKRLTKSLEAEKTLYPGVILPHGTGAIDGDYGLDTGGIPGAGGKPEFVKQDDANFEGD